MEILFDQIQKINNIWLETLQKTSIYLSATKCNINYILLPKSIAFQLSFI